MKSLERELRELRDSGRKLLVPYFMGGLTDSWTDYVAAAVLAGADAVEIGIPFSDPMMDGPVIQEAALRALSRGTTLESICDDLTRLETTVPLIAMTYYNIVLHYGLERAAGKFAASGISGAIIPDLPLEETAPWIAACDGADVATVLLVAPSTPDERLDRLAATTQGRHGQVRRWRGRRTGRAVDPSHERRAGAHRHWDRHTGSGQGCRCSERRRHCRISRGTGDPRRRRRFTYRGVHQVISLGNRLSRQKPYFTYGVATMP
jgi:hypothetical protein